MNIYVLVLQFLLQVCGVTGQQYTYAQLRDHSAALAIRLQRKIKIGDVAAICLPNIPDFAIALLGVLEAGLIVTTINPIYTAGEIKILSGGVEIF